MSKTYDDFRNDFHADEKDRYERVKSTVAEMRERIDEALFGQGNTVDNLMTDKVMECYLLDEQPLGIKIGDKTFFVKSFTLDTQHEFFRKMVALFSSIELEITAFELLSDGSALYELLMAHETLYKDLSLLIAETVVKDCDLYDADIKAIDRKYQPRVKKAIDVITKTSSSWRVRRMEKRIASLNDSAEREKNIIRDGLVQYWIKHASIQTLIQACYMIYLYNFDSVKKNLSIIMGAMSGKGVSMKQQSQTYIWSWLENLTGLTGNIGQRRFQKSISSFADGQNGNIEEKDI